MESKRISIVITSYSIHYTKLYDGNNKTPFELEMAIDAGIGCFVVDNMVELHMLQAIAAEKKVVVNILLRVTPGVEAHTHEYISTGQIDSKFGFDIGNGAAFEAVNAAGLCNNLNLLGVHSHIGSQIFEVEGFHLAVERVADFAAHVKEQLGVLFKVVNLGGGFGIRYTEEDTPLNVITSYSIHYTKLYERLKCCLTASVIALT